VAATAPRPRRPVDAEAAAGGPPLPGRAVGYQAL